MAIKLTQRLTTLSSGGSRVTNVGTSDGTIAGAGVHGALSATINILTPAKFAAKGTLFDAAGTLRYTLNGTLTSGSDGSLHFSGTGTFTGGTGNYRGAHGSLHGLRNQASRFFRDVYLQRQSLLSVRLNA